MAGPSYSSKIFRIPQLERLLMPLSGVDHAIAIALQRFRFGLRSRPGQERRRDGLRSDVEFHDTPTPAIEPEPRRRKEIARRRRQPAEAARRFFFQIVQIIFAPTPGDATIDFEPDRFRLHVARWQHVREHQRSIGCPVVGLLRSPLQKVAVKDRSENLHMAGLPLGEEASRSSEVRDLAR